MALQLHEQPPPLVLRNELKFNFGFNPTYIWNLASNLGFESSPEKKTLLVLKVRPNFNPIHTNLDQKQQLLVN